MGHTRLGKPPTTKKWRAVVATITGASETGGAGAGSTGPLEIPEVSRQAVDAATPALRNAVEDEGLRYSFFLLTQLALASRAENWLSRLNAMGLDLAEEDGMLDLVAELHTRIDDHLFETRRASDIGEMAQQAAGEALLHLGRDRAQTLFGEDQGTVQDAIRALSTRRGFGQLGQEFFGRFVARLLEFYLSRITAAHVGEGNLPHVGQLITFNEQFRKHCRESAYIVRDFSGDWFSKTEYQQGIDQANATAFLAVALKKLEAELLLQRDE